MSAICLDDYTLIASSAEADYPINNVKNPHLSLRWRATGDTSETITMDSTDLDPDGAFIAGTNLTASAVVKIQGNATDIWTSPSVNITMEKKDGIYYSYSSLLTTMKYWRFIIADATNPDGYIEVGRAWLGDSIEVEGPHTNFVETRNNTSITTISLSGQSYGDVGYIYRSWNMAFPFWDDIEKGNIEDFSDYVNKAKPFFVQFADRDDIILGPFYCILTNNIDLDHIKTLNVWSGQLNIREIF